MSGRTKLSRRQCLQVIAGKAVSSLAAATSARITGAQLYAVRSALKREPDRVFQALAGIGFKEVEGFSRPETVALAPKIKQYGLTVRSCQVETPLITANWEPYPELKQVTLPEAIDSLAGAGVEYFTMGYISPGARGDGDDFFRRTADRMNAAAELCRKSGMKFVWPNQGFEFEGRPGLRPVDIYFERLDPAFVTLEMDVVWVTAMKHNPVELLKQWK